MDIFDREYPEISKLYYDYTMSEEYDTSELVNCISEGNSAAIDKAVSQLAKGEKSKATDTITNVYIHSEQAGFILGFTYALGLIGETNVLKELTQ